MKRRDQGGVVDERLNVYGIKGLKVAGSSGISIFLCLVLYTDPALIDASIAPGNVGAVRCLTDT